MRKLIAQYSQNDKRKFSFSFYGWGGAERVTRFPFHNFKSFISRKGTILAGPTGRTNTIVWHQFDIKIPSGRGSWGYGDNILLRYFCLESFNLYSLQTKICIVNSGFFLCSQNIFEQIFYQNYHIKRTSHTHFFSKKLSCTYLFHKGCNQKYEAKFSQNIDNKFFCALPWSFF